MPPDAYFDDPVERIDRADSAESQRKLTCAMASDALTRFGEWITRGRCGVKNRAPRSEIVLLSINPGVSALQASLCCLGRWAAWSVTPTGQ